MYILLIMGWDEMKSMSVAEQLGERVVPGARRKLHAVFNRSSTLAWISNSSLFFPIISYSPHIFFTGFVG